MTTNTPATPHVEALCKALGEGFKIESYNRCGSHRPDDKQPWRYVKDSFSISAPELGIATVSVMVEMHNMKAMVGIDWPRSHDGDHTSSSTYVRAAQAQEIGGFPTTIGLTITRDPDELARAIHNKVIDRAKAFEPLVRAGLEEWAARDRKNRAAWAKMLTDVFGKTANTGGREESYPLSITAVLSGRWLEVKMNESGSMDIEVTGLPQEQAIAILNTIKG